jgi:prolyl oligopeptidase
MGRRYLLAALSVVVILSFVACTAQDVAEESFPAPPETRSEDIVDDYFGTPVADPYRWLEDQEAEETRQWITEQNEYSAGILSNLPEREMMTELFSKLMQVDSISTPTEAGGRYFYTRRTADQDLSISYWRDGLDGEEKVLLDPHPLSDDHSKSAGIRYISPDGKLVAYYVRDGGKDEVEIHFRDVDSGEDLDLVLPEARLGFSMAPDKESFLYTIYEAGNTKIYFHQMGTALADDPEIAIVEQTIEDYPNAWISDNGKWWILNVGHGTSGGNDLYIKAAGVEGDWKPILADGYSSTSVSFAEDKLFIHTNWGAPKNRLMTAEASDAGVEKWIELIPEHDRAVLRSASPRGGKLIANYLLDVHSVVEVFDTDGTLLREIDLGTLGSASGASGHWDSDELFISFSSFHVPRTIFRYDIATDEKTVWAKQEVPVDSDSMELKQVWYESKDGTKIPMFILHKKGIELNGKNPTLLSGYGGFNISQTPGFRSSSAAWVEMGGVYAVANLRGGGEFGEAWHKAGMFENKQNVFDDFIAAGEYLVAEGYATPATLGISGGSNGGLLVGACMVQRPDLFGAVICSVPLLDMVRYDKFMLAKLWVSEYGTADDPEQFEYIYKYSPYHHVKEGVDYPATLFITGDGDTRVAPLHGRKMTALVQAMSSGKNPIMIQYDLKAGHSGGTPLAKQIEKEVDRWGFLKWRLTPSK